LHGRRRVMEVTSRSVDPGQLEQWSLAWNRIVARSWMEPGFRNEVLSADASRLRELCREMGYEVPENVELVVLEVKEGQPGLPVVRAPACNDRIELPLPPPPPAELLAIALEDYACAQAQSPPFCCC
jgi:hypothetical protein